MASSIRRMLSFAGMAAVSSVLLSQPVLAGTPAEAGEDKQVADAFPELVVNAENPPAESEVAQTYMAPSETVVEAFQPATGWYIGIGAGAVWPSDQSWDSRIDGFDPSGDIEFGGGFSGDFAVGYDFGAIRTELSYGYSNPSINDITLNDCDRDGDRCDFGASGSVNKNDIFLSAYWDMIQDSRWTPYIGGGVGVTWLGSPRVTVGDRIRSDSESHAVFGWQAKLGVSYALSYNWDIYTEGTYSGASGFEADYVDFGSYNDFGAKLGFRYRFGSPAVVVVEEPAPQPMPEPAPEPMPMPEPEPAPIRGLW